MRYGELQRQVVARAVQVVLSRVAQSQGIQPEAQQFQQRVTVILSARSQPTSRNKRVGVCRGPKPPGRVSFPRSAGVSMAIRHSRRVVPQDVAWERAIHFAEEQLINAFDMWRRLAAPHYGHFLLNSGPKRVRI
jgi:hypothetical protein